MAKYCFFMKSLPQDSLLTIYHEVTQGTHIKTLA